MTKTAYNPCLRYKFDKLGIIISLYRQKASLDLYYVAQTVKFLSDNIASLNKQL